MCFSCVLYREYCVYCIFYFILCMSYCTLYLLEAVVSALRHASLSILLCVYFAANKLVYLLTYLLTYRRRPTDSVLVFTCHHCAVRRRTTRWWFRHPTWSTTETSTRVYLSYYSSRTSSTSRLDMTSPSYELSTSPTSHAAITSQSKDFSHLQWRN